MMPAHDAKIILSRQYAGLFGAPPPWPALLLLLAQSRGEGEWGGLSGVDAEGQWGGNNWGAVQAKMGPPCPPGTFGHGDSRPTASGQQQPFPWCFVAYPTLDDGARDFLLHALMYRRSAHRALLTGDVRAYSTALYNDGNMPYFGGYGATKKARIQSYVDMLTAQKKLVLRELGNVAPDPDSVIDYVPPFKKPDVAPSAKGLVPLAIVGLVLLIARK